MKKARIAASVFLFGAAAVAQADVGSLDKFSKYCLKDYCLGDTAAKHGGIKQIFEASAKQAGFPDVVIQQREAEYMNQPHCNINDTGPMLAPGDNIHSPNRTEITFSADPKKVNGPLDEYYVITDIRVDFPEISNEQKLELGDKVLKRAGVTRKHDGQINYNAYVGGVALSLQFTSTNAELRVTRAFGDQDHAIDLYRQQPGCGYAKTPNL